MDLEPGRRSGVVRGLSFRVGRDVILRRLKMRPDAYEGAGRVRELFDSTVEWGYRLIKPAAVYKTLAVDRCTRDRVFFKQAAFSVPGSKLTELLKRCRQATLMAATVGSGVSEETGKLMDGGRITEAMILDAFGSEAVEEAVNVLCGILSKYGARRGLEMTRRYSPGYGDWPLREQGRIVAELDAGRIGVSVSRSSILTPEKSITAIAGWQSLE